MLHVCIAWAFAMCLDYKLDNSQIPELDIVNIEEQHESANEE